MPHSEIVPLNADDILAVIPSSDDFRYHWLYLKSGLAVRWAPATGSITNVTPLPTDQAIMEKLRSLEHLKA